MTNTNMKGKPNKRLPFVLSEDDIKLLEGLDADIEHARFELERAKKVGIDVSELEKQLEDAVQLRDNILKTYSPPR